MTRMAANTYSRPRLSNTGCRQERVLALAFTADYFDLWVFRRTADGVEYLLLHTSQEKADRFFDGGRFWQIPTDAVRDDEHITDACRRLLKSMGVNPGGVWSADYVYTIYNRRYDAVCAIPVFAAEAGGRTSPALGREHSEFGWFDAEACLERIRFRGLRDGLAAVRETITGSRPPAPELRLFQASVPRTVDES